ncbi:ApaG protein [Ferrimonas sediminum]|uniref:Protein ApaG n=1 Tax=Ferrimonas sediminum TaxID=718193 RepID=A0A1G8V088_9GAMM|nr:Co2+/Mg2+ efflux protein ApaG [Ferrimonas sediminum]SDJ59488.1 ApaG protein [Ferrimonas sediminum]
MSSRLAPLKVEVQCHYIESQSDPDQQHYLFQYTITLENCHEQALTLTHRHWQITDGNGSLNKVSGEGVVGQTPTLAPGERFEYSSSVALATPVGSMTGFYTLLSDNGEVLQSPIDRFPLCKPRSLH